MNKYFAGYLCENNMLIAYIKKYPEVIKSKKHILGIVRGAKSYQDTELEKIAMQS